MNLQCYGSALTLASAGFLALISGAAAAQVQEVASATDAKHLAPEGELDDIVVTAQRRETRLQSTPVSASVITSGEIERSRIRTIEDAAVVAPTITFAQSNGQQQASIRGVGVDNPFLTAESGVAVYVDGIYLGRPNIATAAFFDLERIEVVRGPQGTLYGRNATGGAINLITSTPNAAPETRATLAYGNYDAVDAGAVVGGALSTSIAGRASIYYTRHDGYVRNLLDGRRLYNDNDLSFRSALKIDATDVLSFTVRGDYQRIENTGPISQPYNRASTAQTNDVQFTFGPGSGRYTNNPRTVFHDLRGDWTRRYWGASVTSAYELDAATLRSITGYRNSYTNQDVDLDGTDGLSNTLHNRRVSGGVENARQFSQELQLISKGGGVLEYTAGLYYFDESARVRVVTDGFDFVCCVVRTDYLVRQRTQSAAGFAEVYLRPVKRLRLTAGLRYTYDHKSYRSTVGTISADGKSWKSWTPRVGADYEISKDLFAYAIVSKGFKAGGFNGYTNRGPYDPERLWNYEAGIKLALMDGRAQLDLNGFVYDYDKIQITQFTGLGPNIDNVGGARAHGVEMEARVRPTRGLDLILSGAYLDTRYKSFDLTDLITGVISNVGGNRLIKSPELSFSARADYRHSIGRAGTLLAGGDVGYKSAYGFSVFNSLAARQSGYAIVNARIGFAPTERLEFRIFAKNLFDKAVLTQATQASSFLLPVATFNPPRTYGVTASMTL